MKTATYVLGLPLVALVASVVACSDDPPNLSRVAIALSSEPDNTSMTYNDFTDDIIHETDLRGDASKGIYLGNGLSYVLDTDRSFTNPPTDSDDKIYDRSFTLTVQGDCVTTSIVENEPAEVVINTVHDGDCTVVFSVNAVAGKVIMPVHVVDQGKLPPSVYPPGEGPNDVADSGSSVLPTDDGGTEAGH